MESLKEGVIEAAKQRLLKLVSLGPVDLVYAPLYYRKLYKEDYTCPLGSKHGLKSCLKGHLSSHIEIYGQNPEKKIRAKQDQILKTGGDIRELSNNQVIVSICYHRNPGRIVQRRKMKIYCRKFVTQNCSFCDRQIFTLLPVLS